jgi:hypothetical protein
VIDGFSVVIDIVQVYMPMDEVLWFENPHEPEKNLESLVTWIIFVMNAFWRSMGEKDIEVSPMKDLIEYEFWQELKNRTKHAKLRVLIYPPIVTFCTPEASKDHSPNRYNLSPDIRRSIRRLVNFTLIFQFIVVPGKLPRVLTDPREIVISKDKQEGFIQGTDDETVIVEVQISCPQNKIHTTVSGFYIRGVDEGVFIVRYAEYLHSDVTFYACCLPRDEKSSFFNSS